MKINKKEVTKIETITEYEAADGTIFKDKIECERYEESALFAVKSTLKKLNSRSLEESEIFGAACADTNVEIYDVQTNEDLMRLKMYCNLRTRGVGYGSSLEKITFGHEVMIVFNYEYSYCWTYADGSIEGILNSIREKFKSAISNDANDTNN